MTRAQFRKSGHQGTVAKRRRPVALQSSTTDPTQEPEKCPEAAKIPSSFMFSWGKSCLPEEAHLLSPPEPEEKSEGPGRGDEPPARKRSSIKDRSRSVKPHEQREVNNAAKRKRKRTKTGTDEDNGGCGSDSEMSASRRKHAH